jgi:DNA repair and recombination protein RAD54B
VSWQTELYQGVVDSYATARKSKGADALGHIRFLRNIVNHPNMIHSSAKPPPTSKKAKAPNQVVALDHKFPPNWAKVKHQASSSGKMQVLQELLVAIRETSNDRIVLVSNYTETLAAIEHVLKGIKGAHFCRLDGSVPTAKRTKMVDQASMQISLTLSPFTICPAPVQRLQPAWFRDATQLQSWWVWTESDWRPVKCRQP